MNHKSLIDEYLAGSQMLRAATDGMTDQQLDARPISGKWSTRQVVCHIADFELVYADRMKRAIAENQPHVSAGDPDEFATGLAYPQRDLAEELQLIESVRRQMARILRTLNEDDFQRTCIQSEEGPLTIETLVKRMNGHIPHHVRFIDEKRAAMNPV